MKFSVSICLLLEDHKVILISFRRSIVLAFIFGSMSHLRSIGYGVSDIEVDVHFFNVVSQLSQHRFFNIYLFGCTGSQLWHMGSSFLTREQTEASCFGSTGSQPVGHQGSPRVPYLKRFFSFLWSPFQKSADYYKYGSTSRLSFRSLCLSLVLKSGSPSAPFFSPKMPWPFQILVPSIKNLRIILSISTKQQSGILIGTTLNLKISPKGTEIPTTLNSPMQELDTSLHLFL